MKEKITSILLILLTLLIGFVAGFLTQSSLHDSRMKQMRARFDKKDGYVEYLKRIMELTPDQEADVQEILDSYVPKMHKHYRQFKEESKARIDSLSEELSPYVTEEQLEKLKHRFKRRRHRPKK